MGVASGPVRHGDGQASIEAIAGTAALLLASIVALQLLAVGYAVTVADGAAEAGAMAMVRGRPVDDAVSAALPGWAESRVEVERTGNEVEVRLRPPSPLESLARRLEVSGSASARPQR